MTIESLAVRAPSHLEAIGAVPTGIVSEPGAAGASLTDVLALLQQRVPAVTGLLVRDRLLYVAYAEPPDDAAAAAARAVLADERALAELASRAAARGDEPAGAKAARSALAGSSPADLRAQLLDASLSDEAWLRAFRRYQVALLSTEKT